MLGLVERHFEHIILFTLLPDSVLQFRLLVKKFVPFFDKFDFVLSIGGISLRFCLAWLLLRILLPRVIDCSS